MRLEQLNYCIEVAGSRSISQAAKRLFISQSSLSTSIQNLEEELGFPVFKRSGQGVSLTDKGEIVIQKAEKIISQVEQIRQLSDGNPQPLCNVTLAAVPAACNSLVVKLLAEIKAEHSRLHLNIIESRPDKILQALLQRQADIVIGSYSESIKGQIYNEAAKNQLVIEPVYRDRMFVFLGRNHPKARQKTVSIQELKDDPQAFFHDHMLMEVDDTRNQSGALTQNYYTFSDKTSIKKVVAKGIAYAVLPSMIAYDDIYIESGWLVALPITDADAELTMYIGYRGDRTLTEEKKQIIEIIRHLYQQADDNMKERYGCNVGSRENNNWLVY